MFRYDHQNFWFLVSIQNAALGLQGLLIGQSLASKYGSGNALIAISVGNLILWVIGLAMISMTYKRDGYAKHALENVKSYLGRNATYLASIVLLFAFLSWFTVQLKADSSAKNLLLQNFPHWNHDISLENAALFAFIITLVSMGGIKTIKWICTASFPFLFLFMVYSMLQGGFSKVDLVFEWNSLFPAIMAVVIIVFPGIINLPTFFRHSLSRADAIIALTLMTLFVAFFQFGSIWLQFGENETLFKPYSPEIGWNFNLYLVIVFVTISTLCINIVNIYFASAAIEIVKPKFADARGYVLIGLIGTLGFGLLQSLPLMNYIQSVTNAIIGSLGAVLLIAYLARMITKHRPRPLEQHVNAFCWIVGSLVSIWQYYLYLDSTKAFVAGICSTAFLYLVIIFTEEVLHSAKTLPKKNLTQKPEIK